MHGNVTSQCILLKSVGAETQKIVKLCSFTAARDAEDIDPVVFDPDRTRNGYMSPEVLQELEFGQSADIWSLGCIFFQMATLMLPFDTL